MTRILRLTALLLLLLAPVPASAQEQMVRLAGVLPKARVTPLLDALAARHPEMMFSYERLSSSQITAESKRARGTLFDLAFLASPDIAVSIANEGFAVRDDAVVSQTAPQWRNEVFGIWSDPAVMVLRRSAFAERMPRTRIELVRELENRVDQFARRVGIVNIGIDDVGYLLASQDSIRTSLYWRLMRAFGSAKARIYETTDELVEALRQGRLDVAYNVPLSSLLSGAGLPADMEIVVPQDYVLAVPWTAFIPKGAPNENGARILLDTLLSPDFVTTHTTPGFETTSQVGMPGGLQRVELGPELLVFRDNIKRSKFLDSWFQIVVN